MKWVVYNLLFALAFPFLLPGFLLRMLRRGGYAARMGDRFALYPEGLFGRGRPLFDRHDRSSAANRRSDADFVWIHAVSVGEVQVAGQLMREWRKVDPSVRFCFSTTSSTGWMMAEKEIRAKDGDRDGDVLIYNPLDFPNFVKSALRTVRPRAIILTESEIWPNFIRMAHRSGIPLFLINARVSDRSAPRYKLARWFFGDIFSCFTRIFAQSDLDASRLRDAGAPADRISVTGSFKFDVAHRNEAKEAELKKWMTGSVGDGRKVILGGSTWPGEDRVLLDIYKSILDAPSSASDALPLLVLAPRHFEKADAVEANIRAIGFDCVRRSRPRPPASQPSSSDRPPVFLADTTGELMGLYGISDVVFVGKSLCAHGSQNMIEPCLCGKPTAVGPFTENFRPVMSDLLASQAIVQVKDAQGLSSFVRSALADDGGLGRRAALAVQKRLGVVSSCVAAIRKGLACLVLAAIVAGCGKDAEKKSEVERSPFRPTQIASACIAAVESPNAVRVLLADEAAEAYRPFFSAFGLVCVSNVEATAESSYGLVFLAGLRTAADFKRLRDRVAPDGVLAWRVDVRDMKGSEFKSCVEAFPFACAHLWMPGTEEWVLVGRAAATKLKLDEMMDLFIRESAFDVLAEAKATALSDVFANYVGPLADTADAFKAGDLTAVVRPAAFVTKEIPKIDWIDPGEVDENIYRSTMAEARSMQVVRRLILEGDLTADAGKSDDATEIWSRAMRRNPRDPMLLGRLDRLSRNAGTLLRIGNVAAAAKCFETMIVINPTDAGAVLNFGLCLRRLGKNEMAKQVLERAKELRK